MEVHAHLWSTIVANLEIAEAACIETGKLTQVVRVNPEIRKQLLAGAHWQELQNIGSRKIYSVKCGLMHGKGKSSDLTHHKEAYLPFLWAEKPIHIECGQAILPDDYNKNIYCVTTGKKPSGVSYCSLQLPSFKDTAKGAEFVIKNHSNDFIELCSQERQHPISGCCQWLGKGEAIMLSRAEKQWEFMGKAGGHRSERVATNPLLRESGPVVDCDQGVINYENDGEYFLTRPVIEHTLRKKLAKQAGSFRYDYCTSPDELVATIKTAEKMPCYFIYENTENNHITAGCVQVSGDDVHCYLHETLGEESCHTEPLVKLIRDKIATAFPGKRVSILLPKERIQRDYASCGVMAINAISYFARHPEWLKTLFEQVKSDDGSDGFDTINVNDLPARIVKLCQERSLIYGHPGKNEKVNSKQTLNEYLSLYKAIAVKVGSGQKKHVNAAAHVKRYKYLIGYVNDRTVNRVAESEVVPKLVKLGKRRSTAPSELLKKKQFLEKSKRDEPNTVLFKEEHFSVLQEHDYSVVRPHVQSQSSRDSSGYGSS